MLGAACGLVLVACVAPNSPRILRAGTHCCMPARLTNVSGVILPSCASALMRTSSNGPQELPSITTYQSDGIWITYRYTETQDWPQ